VKKEEIRNPRLKAAGRIFVRPPFYVFSISTDIFNPSHMVQKKAIMTHRNLTHLGRVKTTSVRANTTTAPASSQRYLDKVHSTQTGTSDSTEPTNKKAGDDRATPNGKVRDIQRMDINSITGMSYIHHPRQRAANDF
jgi:hypothetical protein